MILADREAERFAFVGLGDALAMGGPDSEVDVRLFGKPVTRTNRRMGIALASGPNSDQARLLASRAAAALRIEYG